MAKLTPEERESFLFQSDADKTWRAWSESPRFQRLLKKQGYIKNPEGEYTLTSKAVTIRASISKRKPRSMSQPAKEALKRYQASRMKAKSK